MIKLIKNTFYHEEEVKKKLADFILSARQLSFGEECEKFEKQFADYQNRKHCVFFNSGSSANLALMQALLNVGLVKKGDVVGFSAVTWPTNVSPLIILGFQPVPVDISLKTLNVSSQILKSVIAKNPLKALFLTNLLGFCDDIDNIRKLCEENNILLFEDNCESLGTVYKDRKLGNFGIASTFSFYVGHHLSTIEGGAVCVDDEELAQMLRMTRAHGWDRNLNVKKQTALRALFMVDPFYGLYTFYDLGYNFRPTEIQGFLGNVQISYLNEIIKKRRDNFLKVAPVIYGRADRYFPIEYTHIDFVSNFAIPVICRSKTIRDELIKKCAGKIELRPVVGGNILRQPFFAKYCSVVASAFSFSKSNAEIIHSQGLYFGNNPDMTDEEIGEILSIFSN